MYKDKFEKDERTIALVIDPSGRAPTKKIKALEKLADRSDLTVPNSADSE